MSIIKPYDLGFVCGRFQTFHIGHQSLIDTSIKLCDRTLIFVGSAQESGTERNPLNISTRIDMLKSIYGDEIMIYGLSDLTNENDVTTDWGRYLLENIHRYAHKAPDLMVYGNDEARSKWFNVEDILNTSEFIVNRGKVPISATMLRQLMVDNNREEWMNWVNPKLHKHYDRLRNELMCVDFYSKLRVGV